MVNTCNEEMQRLLHYNANDPNHNFSWQHFVMVPHLYLHLKKSLTLTYRPEMTWKATQSENLGWMTSFLTLCSLLPCGELNCGVQCLLKPAQVQSDSVLPVTTLVRGRFRDRLFLLKVSITNGTHTHSHTVCNLISCLHLYKTFVISLFDKKPFAIKLTSHDSLFKLWDAAWQKAFAGGIRLQIPKISWSTHFWTAP